MISELVCADRLRPGDQIITTDSEFTLAVAMEEGNRVRLRSTKAESTEHDPVTFHVPKSCKFKRVRREVKVAYPHKPKFGPDLRRGAR